MPWRPRNIWRGYQSLPQRDPAAFVLAFALYAGLYGIALLLPGDSFELNQLYIVAKELHIPETPAGLFMLADGVALLACLGWHISPPVRAAIALVTGLAWFFWGGLVLGGGIRAGFFAPGGAWTIVCAVLVMKVTSGWAHPTARPLSCVVPDDLWN